jgi:error-prone DNA polymerase
MGFYAPASLIDDVRRHGVTVRGPDVNANGVLATQEKPKTLLPETGPFPRLAARRGVPVPGQPVIRLGPSEVRNLGISAAEEIVAGQPYADLVDFAQRTTVGVAALEALALGGAFGFGGEQARGTVGRRAAATIRPGQLPGTDARDDRRGG